MPQRRKEPLVVMVVFVLLLVVLLGLFAYQLATRAPGEIEEAMWLRQEHLFLLILGLIFVYFLYVQLRGRHLRTQIVGEKVRTQTVLEALPAGVLVVDDEGSILSANSAACETLAADPVNCLGRPLSAHLDDEYVARFQSGFVGICDARTREGRPVRVETRNLAGGAGRILILHDVAPRPVSEAGQTAARNVGGEAWTGRLWSGIARALEADPPAGVRSALADALLTAGRMSLAARGDDVPSASQRKETALAQVASGPAERARTLARARGIAFEIESDPEARAAVDAVWVERLLDELFLNACAYVPDGGSVRLRIAAVGGSVTIVVQDNGPGIPPEDLPRVTEDGFTGRNQTPLSAGGRGKGLWIARRVAEAHGGSIRIESREGIGTRVTVALPAS